MSFVAPEAASLDVEAALGELRTPGYARLGRVLDDEGLEALRARADDLMLGRVVHEGLFFQHDAKSGKYEDLVLGVGFVGPSLQYRKLEKLEKDPIFRAWIGNRLFEQITRALTPSAIKLYRAVLFNKAAQGGTNLPWHQDGGRFWGMIGRSLIQMSSPYTLTGKHFMWMEGLPVYSPLVTSNSHAWSAQRTYFPRKALFEWA